MKKRMSKSVAFLMTSVFVLSLGTTAFAENEFSDDDVVVVLSTGEFGHFEGISQQVFDSYEKGSTFAPSAVPVPNSECFEFDGWYTGLQGRGERYTETSVINGDVDLYANWKPVDDFIPEITDGSLFPTEVYGMGVIFSFTPDETAMYEAYTTGNDPDAGFPNVRILNDRLIAVANSRSADYDFNAVAATELTAGETYYVEYSSVFGSYLSYNAGFKKSELVPVTFHSNTKNGEKAYFDNDPSVVVKTVNVRKGAHLEHYRESGLWVDEDQDMTLAGWVLDPEFEDADEEIIAESPVDLYAVYDRYRSVILDGNGGCYEVLGEDVTSIRFAYHEGQLFDCDMIPTSPYPDKVYAGWATTPDATEPNVFEGEYYYDLGEVLYAVYADPVKVTFNANGGYFFANPDLTEFNAVYGKGHSFYSVHIENEDPNMEIMGWMDQNGNFIPYSSITYAGYRFTEDTVLTAVWGRYVVIDANGGCFLGDEEFTAARVLFPLIEAFDSEYVSALLGEPEYIGTEKEFAGWATTPDAECADIIDGEFDLSTTNRIYAVWKDC
ncbi:MAG: InlB B-repeat-containing protein [Lachnospiraceae bacterium]|nr:InlB B-repeat-containing protein [Lachnospiraceae bacterium]